jgi:hypothetical protein
MKLQISQNKILFPIAKVGDSQKNTPFRDIAKKRNFEALFTNLGPSVPSPRKKASHIHFEKGILLDLYG